MKYAFIVMIAVYLITYGCSSDEPKKDTKAPQKVETITVDKTEHVAPKTAVDQPAKPAGEQPAVRQQAENLAANQTQPAPDQPQAEQQPMEQEMLFANPEDLVVMPCGRVFVRQQMPCDMPCMKMPQEEDPMVQDEPAMPHMMPQGHHMPEMMQVPPPVPPPASQDELAAALQKMVEATNEMVMVTRQMVMATEEMLRAARGTAGEMIDKGKKTPEGKKPEAAEPPAQPADPAVQPPLDPVPPSA